MRPWVFRGHERPLTCVKFNREGDILFTSGKDGVLDAWFTESGKRLGKYDTGNTVVWWLDCTLDSKYLAAASAGYYVFLFAVETGEMLSKMQEAGPVRYVAFNREPLNQNMLVSVTVRESTAKEGMIKFWKLNFKDDGGRLEDAEGGGRGGGASSWAAAAEEEEEEEERGAVPVMSSFMEIPDSKWPDYMEPPAATHNSKCTAAEWSALDELVVSAHEDVFQRVEEGPKTVEGRVKVWDVVTGEKKFDFLVNEKCGVSCISIDRNGSFLLTGSAEAKGTVKMWRMDDFSLVKTFTSDRPINACCLSPLLDDSTGERPARNHLLMGGGQAAADVTMTASSEGRFQTLLWDVVMEVDLGSVKGHFGPIHCLAWAPDGGGFASGSEDGNVRLYRFDNDYWGSRFS
eukprot:GHVU01220573.1.p1 GENE.GHVU01220573.1~~GHVU01220573.1.p1  ORF type:complete len:402 (+),score=103.22 GHVU01220573.1:517-1722(+)